MTKYLFLLIFYSQMKKAMFFQLKTWLFMRKESLFLNFDPQ